MLNSSRLLRGLVGAFDDVKEPEASGTMRVATLTVIRWVAMAGQLFAVLLVHFSLGIKLPLIPLLTLIALIPLANFWLMRRNLRQRVLDDSIALPIFVFDITQLSGMLALTGGLDNPFSLLMLLPVALAATSLGAKATLLVTGWSLVAMTIVTFVNLPLPWPGTDIEFPKLYTRANWIAMTLALTLIAVYVWQLARDSRVRSDAFAATQLALAREQQLSALGAQAAAVAHRLGTPLATINVIAKELARELPNNHPLAAEIADLLTESLRCREILATLNAPESEEGHADFTAVPLSSFLEDLAEAYRHAGIRINVVNLVEPNCTEPIVNMPAEQRHALANLIENASSFATAKVDVVLRSGQQEVSVVIKDDGPGFPPEVLDRIGEPYISTRSGDGGMGLGIFIAQSLLLRTGATLHFGNASKGAQVRIAWPRHALERHTE